MDKKRIKTSNKNIIHIKRVLKDRMKECYVTGKSLKYTNLTQRYNNL